MTQPSLLIVLAVLVHASFQTAVSVLTLLSGHSFKTKQSQAKLLRLSIAYCIGAFVMTTACVITAQAAMRALVSVTSFSLVWGLLGILVALTGVAILSAYYRKQKGTVLWLPRSIAVYLLERAQKTKNSIESTALGGMTVIAELPFSAALFLVIGALTFNYEPTTALLYAIGYGLLVTSPLLIITSLIGGGHKISQIQRWREQNKLFLQYSSGLGMLVITIYLFVFYMLGASS